MKKILFAVLIVLTLGFGAMAQHRGNDNLFTDWSDVGNGLDKWDDFGNGLRDPGLPGGHGGGDTPAPLGSGLVVLTMLGAGYAWKKQKREK
ncbi:MAG: hypothetical protein IK004_06125 [Bacteroidales bacterium]|nr:hypothetical protein [Bacteroidales bacterium]